MVWFEGVFWASAVCVLYPYLVYPVALGIIANVKRKRSKAHPISSTETSLPSVSVVIAVYNEETTIERRLEELLGQIAASGLKGEVIVVSDGSTDLTLERANAWGQRDDRVRVIALGTNRGKAVALSEGCALAKHEIVVFADARQFWASDALVCLLANFADPDVGAVSGELIVESASGVMAGVGLYWKFEKWLRQQETAIFSSIGVTGAISAVRRSLFRPIPQGTILDDVYWPLGVAMQGFRVIHDPKARAYDRLPERVQDEFRRKVRTLSGNFQLLVRLPAALAPVRNPIWVQYVSHKLMRLVVPWALILMLVASLAVPVPFYRAAFWWQIEFYLLALFGLNPAVGVRFRPASAAASFVVLNAAAWLAFWAWMLGRTTHLWHKTTYQWSALEGVAR